MIKGMTHAQLGPIWYLSEPSDVPYSQNQFLGWFNVTVLTKIWIIPILKSSEDLALIR